MLENGHIKLHRSILKWEWYDDTNTTRLFIHLLLTANWKPEKWRGFVIERGQRVTSYSILSKETGQSIKQIRGSLDKLKETGEVASKSTNKYTVITVKNYDKYQDEGKQEGKQTADKGQAKGKQPGSQRATNEESKKEEDTTTAGNARENDLRHLYQFYEENGFGSISPSVMRDIADYYDRGYSAALIERCLKEAVDCNARNWRYTESVLRRCEQEKITTVSQFEAEKKRHEDKRARVGAPAAAGGVKGWLDV